ncbi:MAG: JmjC domain-containing protein [Woeseiaceae bacterium]
MILPSSTTPQDFLATYWQKRPVLLPQTLNHAALPTLTPDELAWLAKQPDVESRIVFAERTAANISFRVEHGPFEDDYFGKLPDQDWTILVQDIDKHLPEFVGWFDQVPFVPPWRIDDLMVSFAAPGGSVGPHGDNYDVFLCQGSGTRRWQISDDRSLPADENSTDLALLRPFVATATHSCRQGDVLYLPPGIPHWGVAVDRCTTYSIGMRAPSRRELAVCGSRVFSRPESEMPQRGDADVDEFYVDPDLRLDETSGARISARSIDRLYEQELIDGALNPNEAATVLGSQVTDPKAWLDPERLSPDEARLAATGEKRLNVHGMARLAWYEGTESGIAFVNGEAREVNRSCIQLLRQLCDHGNVRPAQVQELNESPENTEFFYWLLEQGAFDLQSEC